MALLFMEETLAIGDQKLKVANLGPVDRGVIRFRDYAIPKGEPYPAGGRVRGAHTILSALRPSGLDARPPESHPIAAKLCHGAPALLVL
jgi:hypothetical protein